MQRLAVHIHLAFVAILVLFALLVALIWWAAPDRSDDPHLHRAAAALAAELAPPGDEPLARIRRALARSNVRDDIQATLLGPRGEVLDALGAPLPWPGEGAAERGFAHLPDVGNVAVLALPDGRFLVVRGGPGRPPGHAWIVMLGALLVAMLTGAYPLARRITRRLEHLRRQVDALGEGDLTARVQVDGRDEVAVLADHFNRAATRIERLVSAQKQALANASHELRSPLARLRLGLELLPSDARPEIRERMARDIEDLDALIGEVLLASRLDAGAGIERREPVEMLALVAEECARYGVEIEGHPAMVRGDERMLRRLVRNLLENARRYGDDTKVEVHLTATAEGGAKLCVCDRGPGVPEAERERIFEAFYRPLGMREGEDGGVGLGLSLVRQIAQRHGGNAHCLPREGGGTCFVVVLGPRRA